MPAARKRACESKSALALALRHILNLFGLAQDGKTNARGLPNLLQLALLAREFSDVIRFTRPAPAIQSLLFGVLAPVARLAGYRANNADYLTRRSKTGVSLEP